MTHCPALRVHRTEAGFWRQLKRTGADLERENPFDPQSIDRLWTLAAREGLIDEDGAKPHVKVVVPEKQPMTPGREASFPVGQADEIQLRPEPASVAPGHRFADSRWSRKLVPLLAPLAAAAVIIAVALIASLVSAQHDGAVSNRPVVTHTSPAPTPLPSTSIEPSQTKGPTEPGSTDTSPTNPANSAGGPLTLSNIFKYSSGWRDGRYDVADRKQVTGIGSQFNADECGDGWSQVLEPGSTDEFGWCERAVDGESEPETRP